MDGSMKSLALRTGVLCVVVLAGCSSVQPTAYSGLASSSELHRDAADKTGRIPYRYSTPTDWKQYTKVIIDPATIYQGADNQFGDMSPADRTALADYATNTFSTKLRTRFAQTQLPGPNTLRVKLTITGATKTTAVLGPASRFDIAGNVYNVVQTARGREGAFTGSIMFAVEIYDASTNQLLNAYVSKQYPNPYNVKASFGALSASKVGIDKGADVLLAQLK